MEHDMPNGPQLEALRHLRNAIIHDGYSPSVRDLAKALGYKSPRSAFLILTRLMEQGWVERKPDGQLRLRKSLPERNDRAQTVEVPLVGNVACGTPLLAEENIEAYIPVSTKMAKPGCKYFFLRAVGDSMNKAGINEGDLILARQQPDAENGDKVVALIDEEATVKEFQRQKEVILLKPRSTNKVHKPFVLSDNFLIQGIVVATIPKMED